MTIWYAGLYLLYTLVLGGLTHVLLESSLQQRDHQHIAMELHEIVELYARSGVAGVQHGVDSYGQHPYFFVRLTGADRATLVLALPAHWVPSALQALDPGRVPATVVWDDIATPDDGNRLEVASLRLADGTVVQVGAMTQGRTDVLRRFRASFALVLLPMLALSTTGVAILAVRTMRPLQSLIHTVQSIAAGALDTRVATSQTASEWDELGWLFNTMLDKIAVLIQGMHDALDNVAHELRTPVARLRASAEVALQQAETHPALYREALADCLEESERLLTTLRTLMDISEAETGVMPLALEPVSLAALLAEVVDLYRYVIDERQLDVSTTAPPTVWVSADPTRLRQVIANLLDNAIKYTPPGGQIILTACQEPTGAAVHIEDTGRGMTPDELGHIWERLYRSDRSRSQRGLGLGLSLVKAVVQAHHGAVAVSSTLGRGSRFTVRFPKLPSSRP